LNLRYILNIPKWELIQDILAKVTGMAIITVDFKGQPVTKHSMPCEFCKIMRSDPENARHCQKCDSRAGLEAVRINKPFIYLCHCNIVDVAIPIAVDDKYVGAIMAGQVLLKDSTYTDKMERMHSNFKFDEEIKKNEKLAVKYRKIRRMSYENIVEIAEIIWHICNYIVEDAITRNILFEMNQKLQRSITGSVNFNEIYGYPIDILEDIKKQIKNEEKMFLSFNKKENRTNQNESILKPALDYISENITEKITLSQMADLCHVSNGYFSRLFSKEMGENFSSYLSKAKIAYARNLLETTDISITELAYSIGFNDSGYFIKLFKKHEGVTPNVYRKHLNMEIN
jgi:ligand-binding sensor protein/AraC-like DNA-binding protein